VNKVKTIERTYMGLVELCTWFYCRSN